MTEETPQRLVSASSAMKMLGIGYARFHRHFAPMLTPVVKGSRPLYDARDIEAAIERLKSAEGEEQCQV